MSVQTEPDTPVSVHTEPGLEARAGADWIQLAANLADEFASSVVEAERRGEAPRAELKRIRDTGLVNLLIPERFGGAGQNWQVVTQVIAELSRTDPNIGALLGYHFHNYYPAVIDTVTWSEDVQRASAANRWLWGHITDPVSPGCYATEQPDGSFRVNGVKRINTGAPTGDVMSIIVRREDRPEFLLGWMPTDREGVEVVADWDLLGMRRTETSTITFHDVALAESDLFERNKQTMVAIARAFGDETRWPERVVVLDEPTAALPGDEVARVFRAIRRACQAGAAIILVSHRLDEVLEVGDRVAVLRDGRVVAEESLQGLGADDLIAMMLGHALVRADSDPPAGEERSDDALFRVTDLARDRVRGVSFALRSGEVLGIAGLVGSGRSELVRLLGGVQRPTAGTIELGGETKRFSEPSEAVAAGIVTVPQNRRRDGVILGMTISENLTLGDLASVSWKGSIRPRRERAEAQALIERFDIRPPLLELPLRLLSGGNQQKVAIARAVRLGPKVLLLDEPTQGVDVGARSEIGEMIVSLKHAGVGIVLASSDLDELLELADRVIVLNRGRVRVVLHRNEIVRDRLALALAGPELERRAA